MRTHSKPKDLNYLQTYLVEEFLEDYQEGAMTRRQALKYVAAVIGSVTAAGTLLAGCAPGPAQPAAGTRPATIPTAESILPAAALPTTRPTMPAPAQPTALPTPDQIRATATQATLATAATLSTPTPQETPAGVRVSVDDLAVQAAAVSFPGDGLTVQGYTARPRDGDSFPAILVCHENRGLTDHIRDVARRLAKAGYVALAVDLLSSQGGTDKVSDPAQIPGTLGNTPPDVLAGYLLSGLTYLQGLPYVAQGRLGMVGFCFGGGMTWLVATKAIQLKAAVPFYGPNPPLDQVPDIRAAVLGIYGGEDTRIDAGIPAIEEAMKQSGKVFEKIVYPGAAHAFHNDTGRSYNAAAATDAWTRTLAWFAKYV